MSETESTILELPKPFRVSTALHYRMCHRVQVGTKALKATGSDLVEEPNEGSLAFRPPALVEMYDRQVYLSHLQARALYEGLGRSLSALSRQARQTQREATKPEGPPQES
jgi:hypothetical protein